MSHLFLHVHKLTSVASLSAAPNHFAYCRTEFFSDFSSVLLQLSPYKSVRYCFVLFLNVFILFIYFWLHWVFVAVRVLSLVAASGVYSSLWCMGFVGVSLRWLLLLWSTGSRRAGFSSCGMRAQNLWLAGSRAQA